MSRLILHDVEQRSDAWFAVRLGKLTGSVASAVVATLKNGGEPSSRRDLRVRLALERITGQPLDKDGYINADMQRGIDCEPVARAAYEAMTGVIVSEVGFVEHAEYAAGCSPDGYLGEFHALVSIKCPKMATHLGYLTAQAMPSEYVPQMLHECWITGARRYEFVSFDDRFPDGLRVHRVSVDVSNDAVDNYAAQAVAFLREVDKEHQGILDRMGVGV